MDIKKAQETLTEARQHAVLRSDYAARDEILDVQIWVHELAEREKALTDALKACLVRGNRWHPCDPVVKKARAALALHKEDA